MTSTNKTSAEDILIKLDRFTPYELFTGHGFLMGDERKADGTKQFFFVPPHGQGSGSFNNEIFHSVHSSFPVCIEAAKEIKNLRDVVGKLETIIREGISL